MRILNHNSAGNVEFLTNTKPGNALRITLESVQPRGAVDAQGAHMYGVRSGT